MAEGLSTGAMPYARHRQAAAIGVTLAVHVLVFLMWRLSSMIVPAPSESSPAIQVDLIAKGAAPTSAAPPPPTLFTPQLTLTLPKPEVPRVEITSEIADEASTSMQTAGDPNATDTIESYHRKLVRHLQQFIIYPPMSTRWREQGVVFVRLIMTREGKVVSARVEKPSRFKALDQESVAVMQRAQPLPVPPATIPGNPLTFILPVTFSLTPAQKEP